MSINFGPEWMRKQKPTNNVASTKLSNINNNSMDNYSKGKTAMNDHKAGSNQYKYSKDEVMSIWNNKKKPNNKKMSFDYDKNISSTEPLNSMSMMSFNNYDKKILGQNSVSNDMTSRTSRDYNERTENHFKDRNDSRLNSRPFSYNRGSYDQMANGRNDFSMDPNRKIGNIWESQNRSNNYMGNSNMYSLKNKNDFNKKPKFKSMSTPLNKDIEMDGVQSNNIDNLNMKDNSNDLTNTFDNMSLKTNYSNDKSMNNSLFNNDIFPFNSNSLNVTKTQSFDDPMKTLNISKMDNIGLQGSIFNEPDSVKEKPKEVTIESPKWNYKDPSGKIQGPFLYNEMQEWYNAGYFEKNLPVKKENDDEFKSLSSIIEQYGEEKPFIIEAENYIKKKKELNLKANEVTATTATVQTQAISTSSNSKPSIKPIQKTIPSSTHQSSLDANVTSPIGNKKIPVSSYSVGGGIGLGRGIGMKENNSFSNNLDSMYNSFNNNTINSPKVYTGRNASFPTMGNQYEPVGYPGMSRLSTGMNNPQMMGMPGSQTWVPYNDPSLLGFKGMMGYNDIYSNQYYNYDLMNPDLNKSNFNQQFYYQLMQQTHQFPPQYYQMMRQMPQNQIPLYNMFGQPINAVGMKPQMVSNPNIGAMQNEIIPIINNTTAANNSQSLFSGSDTNQNSSQNTSNNMWNTTSQSTNNNSININKAEKNKTDSIPNVDNTNTEAIITQSSNNETINNTKIDSIANDIPINEANTEKKDNVEEIKESEKEQNEEPVVEVNNEESQEIEENKEELVEEAEEEEEIEKEEEKSQENIEEEKSEEHFEEEDKEKEEKSPIEDSNQENNEKEVKEEIKKPISPAPAPIKNHWKISSNKTQSLSIKEIQEMEEKEKLEQLKKHQQEIKEKQEAAAKAATEATNNVESSPISLSEPTTVWGAPHNSVQKSLRQIMQEEENNKKKQKDLQMKEAENKKANKTTSHVVVNTTRSVWAGRPLTIIADSNSKVVTASSLNAAKKESVKKEVISSSTSRSQPSQVSTSVSNTPTTAKSENEWTPVGKVVKKSEQPSQKITKSSSKTDNSKKGPSDAFMKWCKNALRVSTSAGVNVDEFVNVLLLMPLNETSVIYDICTDTLGGITAIDPLKFAEEFIKRRKMDQNDQSFSAVRGYNSYTHDDNKNSNKFIPVKGSGRKKNRQNLN